MAALACGALVVAPALASAATTDAGAVIAGNESEPRLQIDQARAAGLRQVSFFVNWSRFEPNPDNNLTPGAARTRFEELGATFRYARSRGVKVLVTFKTPPVWARSTRSDPRSGPAPGARDDFAAFVGDLAREYGDSIDVYAVWNEPNIDQFWLNPDPAAYAALHRATAVSIRQNDPTARVMIGPIAGNGPDAKGFLRRAYAAGLRGYVNLLGWNTYPATAPERGSPSALDSIFGVATLMRRVDPGRRAWITETSWSTCTACGEFNVVTPAVQSDYLVRTLSYRRRYLRGFIDQVNWYNLTDGQDPARWASNHGLRFNDRRAKPAYTSLRLIDRRLAAPRGLKRAGTSAGASVSSLRMSSRRGRITVRAGLRITGAGRLRVEGYWRGRWRPIDSGAARTGAFRTTIDDDGWRAVRIRAKGARGGWALAGAVVPNAPAISTRARR